MLGEAVFYSLLRPRIKKAITAITIPPPATITRIQQAAVYGGEVAVTVIVVVDMDV